MVSRQICRPNSKISGKILELSQNVVVGKESRKFSVKASGSHSVGGLQHLFDVKLCVCGFPVDRSDKM